MTSNRSIAGAGLASDGAFKAAYLAADQDTEILLRGRIRDAVSPTKVKVGDLLQDEGFYKLVERLDRSSDQTQVYAWFIVGTPGYRVRILPVELDVEVWRVPEGDSDGAG